MTAKMGESMIEMLAACVREYGVPKLAKKMGVQRPSIYRIIRKTANPRLKTLRKYMDALGLEFVVSQAKKK